jgi:glycosyltransferase involved in cell wall biosynthesis
MSVKISLLMPCYNGAKFIAQAVESVLAQSMADWELLISDDGSTDGTVDYLRSLDDPRIRVFFQPRNLGIFGNLNFLFSQANAPFSQILCQDDYLLGPQSLQRILDIWAELPAAVAFLRCDHGQEGSYGLLRLEQRVLPPIIEPKDSDLYFFIFGCIPGYLSNVSVRTPLVEQMGWFRTDLTFSGDFEFWSRVGRVRSWALNTSHVVHIRRHPEQASVTLNRNGEMLPQQYSILERLYREVRSRGYRSLDLRTTATVMYGVRNLDRGVKDVLTGAGWHYLKLVKGSFVATEGFLGTFSSWLTYVVTAGGRLFGPTVAQWMLSRRPSKSRSVLPSPWPVGRRPRE